MSRLCDLHSHAYLRDIVWIHSRDCDIINRHLRELGSAIPETTAQDPTHNPPAYSLGVDIGVVTAPLVDHGLQVDGPARKVDSGGGSRDDSILACLRWREQRGGIQLRST